MSELRIETNSSDEKLREYLLTFGELAIAEAAFAGSVRILSATRYTARVQTELGASSAVWSFTLRKFDGEHRTFTTSIAPEQLRMPAGFREFVYHRAAETMLALRKGHMEHRRNRKRAKAA